MDDDLITTVETPESIAAEEAAFAESFNTARGNDDAPKPVAEELPTDELRGDAPAEQASAVEVTPEPEPTPEPPKLFAGLTEDQLQAALARSGSLQGTVDKMAGRIGQLMQQIEALRTNPPTTQQAQKALDLKLEKLSGAFPELATLLREDLAGLQGGVPAAELPAAAPAGITQEQFDAALAERLKANQAALTEQMEVKVLTIVHPDWNQIIKTNEFALWRDNVLGPEKGKELMFSEDSSFISQRLTEFKNWRAGATAAPVVPAVVAPKVVARTTRLTNAVLPAGGAAPTQAPVTEEAAFAAAFNRERGRAA